MTDFWLARGLRLRELREAKGMSRYALAHQLAMSDAQLRQIEENDSSLFYSAAIRATAVRKVADFLGEPIVSAPETESLVLLEAMDPLRVCYQTIEPVNSTARRRTHWVRFSQGLQTVWRPALLGVLAVVAVSLWVKGTTKIPLVRAAEAPHLGTMQVYFQGALARPPNPASMRLRLIAASHL